MGIFKKAIDKPKVEKRTAGSSYTFFMGSSSAGKSVTERSAMQMTAVYAYVRILYEAVAVYIGIKMTVDRDENGQFYYTYQTSNDETKTMEGPTMYLSSKDVLIFQALALMVYKRKK